MAEIGYDFFIADPGEVDETYFDILKKRLKYEIAPTLQELLQPDLGI